MYDIDPSQTEYLGYIDIDRWTQYTKLKSKTDVIQSLKQEETIWDNIIPDIEAYGSSSIHIHPLSFE